ncbi:MAG: serine/threonine-protein kinase, partial [Gemmataceae bacterium]
MTNATEHRSELLPALLAEQMEGWERGARPPVEEYVARHPGLANDPHALLALVFAEVSLRQAKRESPRVDEYAARFPAHAAGLRAQWDLSLDPRHPSWHEGTPTLPVGPARSAPRLPVVPGFETLRELGRGGMGVVYEARQIGLDRAVALKLFPPGAAAGVEWMARFRREARAAALIEHPNVVRIHHAGEHDGQPYLAMEYVRGESLAARLKKGGPLDARTAAALIRDVARAVQVIHDTGIVHRDLKPGNILLTAEGSPKVADFGLAKVRSDREEMTETDRAMGTPPFMSPEQAAGRSRDAGVPADVWALGATLYSCLTARPPFRGDTTDAVLRAVRDDDPPPVPAGTPVPLEAVCLKCLEKRPKDRFATAAAVADELDRWLAGEPVQTPSPGPHARLFRRLGAAAFSRAALFVFVAGTVFCLSALA